MNVVTRKTLSDFWALHPQAEGPLTAWYALVAKAQWNGPADVKSMFRTADFLADNRVVWNIGGNNYRLIGHISFEFKAVMIKFLGTHAQYDAIDAATVGDPRKKQGRK